MLKSKKNKKPLLVACDVYRPAAIEQLRVLAEQIDVPMYSEPDSKNPVAIAQNAIQEAKAKGYDLVIVDTAGRLAVDEEMMNEIAAIKKAINPDEILFVVDSMTGQDAVNTAKEFNERLDFNGVVLTKLDGDTRGGAALSIRSVVNKPIKFVGTGEKLDAIDQFHPSRMADRILGMGDIVSLVERAQEQYDEEEAKRLQKKIAKNQFDFNDFLINLAPVVLIVIAATLVCILFMFRKELPSKHMSQEEVDAIDISSAIEDRKIFNRSLTVLALTIAGFVVHGYFGLQSATVALTGGFVALFVCGLNPDEIMKEVDLDTLMFFMGLFVLVGGMENAGVITAIAQWGIELVNGNYHLITYLILFLSGIASAFIDNIPFTATMIPLIKDMQSLMGISHADYMWWALATGACFGGNGTMIGASPNVIMVAIAAKEGHNISFGTFMKWCFPLMLLSLFIAAAYIEVRYFIL